MVKFYLYNSTNPLITDIKVRVKAPSTQPFLFCFFFFFFNHTETLKSSDKIKNSLYAQHLTQSLTYISKYLYDKSISDLINTDNI